MQPKANPRVIPKISNRVFFITYRVVLSDQKFLLRRYSYLLFFSSSNLTNVSLSQFPNSSVLAALAVSMLREAQLSMRSIGTFLDPKGNDLIGGALVKSWRTITSEQSRKISKLFNIGLLIIVGSLSTNICLLILLF